MPDNIILAIIFIMIALVGAITCYFGRISLKIVSSLSALAIGLFSCMLLLDSFSTLLLAYKVIAGIASGLALAVILWFVPSIAIFLSGFFLGVTISLLLFLNLPQIPTILLPIVLLITAVPLGVFTLIYKKNPVIITTSYWGTIVMVASASMAVLCFSGNIHTFSDIYINGIQFIISNILYITGIILLLGTSGILTQRLFRKKDIWFCKQT